MVMNILVSHHKFIKGRKGVKGWLKTRCSCLDPPRFVNQLRAAFNITQCCDTADEDAQLRNGDEDSQALDCELRHVSVKSLSLSFGVVTYLLVTYRCIADKDVGGAVPAATCPA